MLERRLVDRPDINTAKGSPAAARAQHGVGDHFAHVTEEDVRASDAEHLLELRRGEVSREEDAAGDTSDEETSLVRQPSQSQSR